MHPRTISLRAVKFLGKIILGFLLVIVLALAVIHLPPVQRRITAALANYLSSKMETRVEIQSIEFSLLGKVTIEDITIWSPDHTKIFSSEQIEVASAISNLVRGNLIFDKVHIAGVDFHLIQDKGQLNIQFIFDAFQSGEASSAKSNAVTLLFKSIQLDSIHFKFTSIKNGTVVDVNIGRLDGKEAEFITSPNKIRANSIYLNKALVNVFQSENPENNPSIPDSTKASVFNLFSIDSDLGIDFEVTNLNVENSNFSLHNNRITTTPKFDPTHIQLQDIQINLTDILVNEDTLNGDLLSLSAQMPSFKLNEGRFALQWNRQQFALTNLHLASNTNQLDANLKASALNSNENTDLDNLELTVLGKINPEALAYFLSDSLLNPFINWKSTEVKLEGNYNQKQGLIKTLNLKTANSYLQVDGKIADVLDLEKLSWKDLRINSTIGSDFKEIITPFVSGFNIPDELTIQALSSGTLKNIMANGKINTNWGNVQFDGLTTLHAGNAGLDVTLSGEKVDLGKWVNVSALGSAGFSLVAKGNIGTEQNLEIKGSIPHLEILDQSISNITIESLTTKTNSIIKASIKDPTYQSEIHSEVSFSEPLTITTTMKLDDFKPGTLFNWDSTLSISGDFTSKLILNHPSLEGSVEGKSILLQNQSTKYLLDTMAFRALMSPAGSELDYYSDNEKGKLVSNFDIRDSQDIIQKWINTVFNTPDTITHLAAGRTINFNLEAENANLFQLLGIDVDNVSNLQLTGGFNEQNKRSSLQATSGKFKGYGISLDTLYAIQDILSARMMVTNLYYDSIALGNVNLDMVPKDEIIQVNLMLANDSLTLLGLKTRILPTDSSTLIYPDKLLFLDKEYLVDSTNPVSLRTNNLAFNHFLISRADMEIKMNGDLNTFDISLKNVNLTPLNYLLAADTTIINKGLLTGTISYAGNQELNLKATVDSLILYNSEPVTITASARSNDSLIPFEFLLTNESNEINLNGQYSSAKDEVDASLKLDVNNLELFSFLVSEIVSEMNGTLRGETTIRGPLKKPTLKGYLQFLNVGVTTVNPTVTFKIPDDRILIDDSIIHFDNFTLFDQANNPLHVNGSLDYQTLSYNLQLNAKDYALLNTSDSASGNFKGQLVIDSKTKIKGRKKDATVEANLTIKDATKLTYVTPQEDIELLKAEGIVEFVDPTLLLDSVAHKQSISLYDSLLAGLPNFNLNSSVQIEKNAVIKIILDEESGDYLETSGEAALELGYDRTGNLKLAGNYTVSKGIYSLSFYNLVKKNFTLVNGSSINWNGSPKNGDLSIKAVHTVESNSIGLIGNEIGENEKSVYERALDYEVGINIDGTIEKPIVSFSLDLPQKEKANYPVLANKLDRLRQPEYTAELNKQVFGLLVLGGFLPESSSADINSSTIAATALSNSVNSLLASQLNRFASQYIKNVNIDVGIQSYSDYTTPGGKTQTAMDFRVSKSIMDDRLSFEVGGDFNLNQDQSGSNTGKNYRGDFAIIYDLTGKGDKQLKLFNNQTYDIIYQEIRNTGISLIFIREFASKGQNKNNRK
jgi:translocation and assembly module TamB